MKKITEKQKTFIQNLLSKIDKIDPEHLAKIQELKNIKTLNELTSKEASKIIEKLLSLQKESK